MVTIPMANMPIDTILAIAFGILAAVGWFLFIFHSDRKYTTSDKCAECAREEQYDEFLN